MKITKSLIEKISELEKLGVVSTKIESLLDLDRSVVAIKEEFKKYQDCVSLAEATSLLRPHLGTLKDERGYELKVLRLIKKGEITANKPSNKEGYKIPLEEINRYIDECKMTKDDWRKKFKESDAKLAAMKKQMEELEKKLAKQVETSPEVVKGQLTIEEVSEVQTHAETKKNVRKTPSGDPKTAAATKKDKKDEKTVDPTKKGEKK